MIMESNLTVLSVIIKRKTENQDSVIEYAQSPSWRNRNLVDNYIQNIWGFKNI